MNCPTCRSEIEPGARFCVRCGARFEPGRESDSPDRAAGEFQDTPIASPESGGQTAPVEASVPADSDSPTQFGPAPPPAATEWAVPVTGNAAFTIRPLGLGELFDTAIKIYFRHFWTILGTAALVIIPAILGLLIFGTGAAIGASRLNSPGAVGFAVIPILFAFVGLYAWQWGALIQIVSDIYMGNKPTILGAYGAAFRRILRLVPATILFALSGYLCMIVCVIPFVVLLSSAFGVVSFLLSSIIPFVGIFMALIPGSYLFVTMSLFACAIMFEDKRILASLGRSMALVKGSFWRYFVVLFLVFVGLFLVGVVLGFLQLAVLRGGSGAVVAVVVLRLVQFALSPIISIVTILFYYDLRVRKEGFDLEIMAREISGAQEPATVETP